MRAVDTLSDLAGRYVACRIVFSTLSSAAGRESRYVGRGTVKEIPLTGLLGLN